MRRHAKAPLIRSAQALCYVAAAVLVGCLAFAAPALAATTHNKIAAFDGADTDAGAFADPVDVAVHQSTGTVYVLDTAGGGVIDKFNADGIASDFTALGSSSLDGSDVTSPDGPLSFDLDVESTLDVDNSGSASDGHIAVLSASKGTAWIFDSAGSYLFDIQTGFSFAGGIAIDSAGDIWISNSYGSTVVEFDASGSPTGVVIKALEQTFHSRLAFDGSDNLYALSGGGSSLDKYDSSGSYQGQLLSFSSNGPAGSGLAIDPSNGHVLVSRQSLYEEFGSSGELISSFGHADLSAARGTAIRSSTGSIYVTDLEDNEVHVFGPAVTVPTVGTGSASDLSPNGATATLNGTVDPDGIAVTSCHFEYGTTTSYGSVAPCQEDPGSGSGEIPVSASITGLSQSTTYHFRLVASNANGTMSGEDRTLLTHGLPLVRPLDPGPITSNSAWIGASVNPQNSAAKYYVEYSTDPTYATSISLPASQDASLGSGTSFTLAARRTTDLQPSTTYHYRVVATNIAGTTVGESRTFVTPEAAEGPGHGLPDGRVYEKASPADKGGADINRASTYGVPQTVSQASETGDSVAYSSMGNFGGDGGALNVQYIARRTAEGWKSEGINGRFEPFPSITGNFSPFFWLSEDLSLGITWIRAALNPGDQGERFTNLYLRDNRVGAYRQVSRHVINPTFVEKQFRFPFFQGVTQDGGSIVFGDDSENPLLWEWKDGVIREVGILPDGSSTPAFLGTSRESGEPQLPGFNAISEDGDRIYFSPDGSSSGQVYLRDFSGATPTTTLVTGSERAGADPDQPLPGPISRLELASKDGSVAFFTMRFGPEPLTDATPGEGDSLYRWEANASTDDRLTDITTADPLGAGVLGSVVATGDARLVYFVATGKLTTDAFRGIPNLYLWEEGEGIELITPLSPDRGDGDPSAPYLDTPLWTRAQVGISNREVRMTPDGRYLAFASHAPLTAYDTAGTRQVYLYDRVADRIVCISCATVEPHSTATSSLASVFGTDLDVARYQPSENHMPRNLSDDGKRVIFDSEDALVPEDSNGLTDVYQWYDGKITLVSAGHGTGHSQFFEASADSSMRDIFFTTGDQLVPSDRDALVDLYDARIGGRPERVSDAPCVGDECQGTPTPPPAFETPGSASFSGGGNQPPERKGAKRCSKTRAKAGRARRCKPARKRQRHRPVHAAQGRG